MNAGERAAALMESLFYRSEMMAWEPKVAAIADAITEAENAAREQGIAQGRAEVWGEVATRAAEQWSALAFTARACRKTWGAGFTLISLHLLIPFWARATGYTPETDQ